MPPLQTGRVQSNPQKRLKADVQATSQVISALYSFPADKAKRDAAAQARRSFFASKASPLRLQGFVTHNIIPATKGLLFGGRGLKGNIALAKGQLFADSFSAGYHHLSRSTFYRKPVKDKSYYSQRTNYRRLISHELIHSLGLSNNHLVAASAVEKYLSYLRQGRKEKLRPSLLLEKKEIMRAINSSFSGWRRFVPVEHLSVRGFIPSNLGAKLGYFAADFERREQKPGIGGILVREVSNGIPINEVVEHAKNGDYDLEAKLWLQQISKANKRITTYYFG